jgi:hypothetical protein
VKGGSFLAFWKSRLTSGIALIGHNERESMISLSRHYPRVSRPPTPVQAGWISGLLAASILAGCSAGEPVTIEALNAARQTWDRNGPRDYELEWKASGISSAHYYVTVRGGSVSKVESIAPDGGKFLLHPAEPRFFGVDGLFTTIADELAQLRSDRPFGQPPGTRVVMRFTTDPKLGYLLRYRRDVLGTSQGLAIDVIRLIPTAGAAGPSLPAAH